jgi:tetratricopeptide (TPR) repeat protein
MILPKWMAGSGMFMHGRRRFLIVTRCVLLGLTVQFAGGKPGDTSVPVSSGGTAQTVIVVGQAAGESTKFAANELQKYLRVLSGAEVPIVSDQQSAANSRSSILVGGPDRNRLVKRAVDAGVSGFAGLKPDGFVLKTAMLDKRPVVVAGGNDDAATMYAVFELVRQLGVTFRLTGDIVPAKRASLQIPALDLRIEPAISQRGFLVELSHHPSVTMLSYQDWVRIIDQMAKMKYNDLKLWWFAYSPYLKYSYRGEAKQIGDISTKESGYLNSVYAGGGRHTTDDVAIGKHWFPSRRLAPPELQHVETPDEAFAAAQDLMRRVIHYAKSRHINVWLVDEISVVPPNLARHGERIGMLPFEGVFGTFMHPLDPVNREIQVNRLKAFADTYPEAAGYLLNFSEVYVPQNNAKHRSFYAEQQGAFQELRPLMAPWADRFHIGRPAMIDSDIGYFDLFKYLLAKRDEVAPKAKLGLMTVGRGYVLPLFDKMLPKDVPFMTFDTGGRCGYGTPEGMPMRYFDGMGQRERTMTPYLDDDCDMLGLQFNVGAYTAKDHIFSDGVKYGLTGVAPWMVEPRGTEANSSFLAEADWNPQLTLQQFYQSYSERLFGSDAASEMYQAFLALEENQAYLDDQSPGYGSDQRPTTISCCGIMSDVRLVHSYSQQPNPFDGPKDTAWTQFVIGAPQQIGMYEGAITRLEKALAHMTAAAPKVDPRGRQELAYLKNRTEAYRDTIRAVITQRRAILAFDQAFRKKNSVSQEKFAADLEASSKLFAEAAEEAKAATAKYAEIIDFPSDLENLYNLNVQAMLGYDLIRQWMEKIVNFSEGKPYTEHVPFERLTPLNDVQVARSNAVID